MKLNYKLPLITGAFLAGSIFSGCDNSKKEENPLFNKTEIKQEKKDPFSEYLDKIFILKDSIKAELKKYSNPADFIHKTQKELENNFKKINKLEKITGSVKKQDITWYGENHTSKIQNEYILNELKKRDPSKTIYLAEFPKKWEKSIKKWLSDSTYNDGTIPIWARKDIVKDMRNVNNLGIEIRFIDGEPRLEYRDVTVSIEEKGIGIYYIKNKRDMIMAKNIYKIIKENPNKEIVIHTGSFHAIEYASHVFLYGTKVVLQEYPPAARILKETYGIDPKTIRLQGGEGKQYSAEARHLAPYNKEMKSKRKKLFDQHIKLD